MATDTAKRGQRDAGDVAHDAARSTTLRRLAQVGLLGYTLIHLLIAWLALQVTWAATGRTHDSGGRTADQAGAMALLASSLGGRVLLWVLALALAALCAWQAVEVFRHHRSLPPPGERASALLQLLKTLGTALVYGYLAVSAARTALGHGQGRASEQHTVRGVLGWPGGREIVVAVAACVAAIGVYQVQKGVRSAFLDEIDLDTVSPTLRRVTHRVSQVGFVLKGTALVLVAVVVAWAAVTFDPRRANGMDGAVRVIAAEPAGRWLLTTIAIGLVAFCAYCLARARHPVG